MVLTNRLYRELTIVFVIDYLMCQGLNMSKNAPHLGLKFRRHTKNGNLKMVPIDNLIKRDLMWY